MSLNIDEDNLRALDIWFAQKCNGQWEHDYGVEISTCDNPGWLLTFTGMSLSTKRLADELEFLLQNHGAEVAIDGSVVRIFSRSLRRCLAAAARLIDISESEESDKSDRKKRTARSKNSARRNLNTENEFD